MVTETVTVLPTTTALFETWGSVTDAVEVTTLITVTVVKPATSAGEVIVALLYVLVMFGAA